MKLFIDTMDWLDNYFVKNVPQSIIYKHTDYSTARLPVLNTPELSEYHNLVFDKKMGQTWTEIIQENILTLLLKLNNDKVLRSALGNRHT